MRDGIDLAFGLRFSLHMQTDSLSSPWAHHLTATGPAPWREGFPILTLCAMLWLWLISLVLRFLEGDLAQAGLTVSGLIALWFGLQLILMRRGVIERATPVFSSILQALTPTFLVATWALATPTGHAVTTSIAEQVTILELVAIHILRLAAWGTVKKYQDRQLPRYFFLFGSIPDFGFAIGAVLLTGLIWYGIYMPGAAELMVWSIVGMAAFLGAATAMYFGVSGNILSLRWHAVERGLEPPTLLPFRWPMNLAPAFCAPVFWLAHLLMIFKLMG